jgi:hypothetical protein
MIRRLLVEAVAEITTHAIEHLSHALVGVMLNLSLTNSIVSFVFSIECLLSRVSRAGQRNTR